MKVMIYEDCSESEWVEEVFVLGVSIFLIISLERMSACGRVYQTPVRQKPIPPVSITVPATTIFGETG